MQGAALLPFLTPQMGHGQAPTWPTPPVIVWNSARSELRSWFCSLGKALGESPGCRKGKRNSLPIHFSILTFWMADLSQSTPTGVCNHARLSALVLKETQRSNGNMAVTKHLKTESQVNGQGHTGPPVRKLKDTHHLGLFPPPLREHRRAKATIPKNTFLSCTLPHL